MNSENNSIPKTGKKIIGFGNIYMSDDAVGLRVLEELKGRIKGAELIDGGTSAADLIIYAKDTKKIIIIDAVDAGQDIGEIVKFKANEISHFKHRIKSFSLHDFDLAKALGIIKGLKIDVEIVVIGIKPKNINFGNGLSTEVEKKIAEITDMVVKEVND
ncbi:MAG: hydrogenase maturation protease [Candidatus Humimicrobiaceae bacterium]